MSPLYEALNQFAPLPEQLTNMQNSLSHWKRHRRASQMTLASVRPGGDSVTELPKASSSTLQAIESEGVVLTLRSDPGLAEE